MPNINENKAINNLVSKPDQNLEKSIPPITTASNPEQKDILTLRKHSMDYFTRDGVILRTGYDNIAYWYLLCLKELWDNASDFLTKHYKGVDDTQIITRIDKNDNVFKISVRNSNYKDIEIFQNKDTIFNYDGRSGTKQGVYAISRGLLGDAMKQLLSLGYVMSNLDSDASQLSNKQWERPLIIRHNGEEWHVRLYVDKIEQRGYPKLECVSQDVKYTDTEIELILPIVNAGRYLTRQSIEVFCKEYATLTTDITFKFRIVDDSTPPRVIQDADPENEDVIITSDNDRIEEEDEQTDEEIERSVAANIISALTTPADKAIVNLEFPALHPISTENLNNANSAHTCTLSEFADRIINTQNKADITIHEFLQTYREGTQLPKTPDNQRTLEELVFDSNRDIAISKYHQQLKAAIRTPAKEITLPYKKEERKNALIKRISKLYDIDRDQKPVYKLIHGMYDDTKPRKVYIDKNTHRIEQGKGLIKYPFVFEIIAIPRKEPLKGEIPHKPKQTIFIGAVNYSTSPKANIFEGEYGYLASGSRNILSVLENCKFHTYHGPSSKLPCIIIGNLITLRREPHGYDKSRIDIQPFSDTIIEACIRVAKDIKTYRGDGYSFTSSTKYNTGKQHKKSNRQQLEEILVDFLHETRGLPK